MDCVLAARECFATAFVPIFLKRLSLVIVTLTAAVVGPSLVFAQQASLTDDAYTSGNKVNKNFGADETLILSDPAEKEFLKFKLTPNLPPGTLGSHVGKATLKLFLGNVKTPGTVEIHTVLGAWSEATVTNATAPAIGPAIASVTVTADQEAKWLTIDLTQSVKDWLDLITPNNGIALLAAGGAEVSFDSKENRQTSHEPRLEIVLNHALTADQATNANTAATISGVLPANKGGTGLTTPGMTGNVLRSNGVNWTSAPLLASDFPGLANSFIQNQNTVTPQTGNFNISGNGAANVFSAATQYNIRDARVFSVTGGNVSANGVGPVPNSNTFGGVDAGASNIASATTSAGNFNTLFGVKAGMNTAKTAAVAPFDGCCNSFFGNLVGLKNTTGHSNAFFGGAAGIGNTTGNFNSFFGDGAGSDFYDPNVARSLTLNIVNATTQYNLGGSRILSTAGIQNTFLGLSTGASNVGGCCNAFFGFHAGQFNNANDNSFFGNNAGASNTTGSRNSFFGSVAGIHNTTGINNSFFGVSAGQSNSSGEQNTFVGERSGISNTTGFQNSFFGSVAGFSNQVGSDNSFFGVNAGRNNTADSNAFFGALAGQNNTSGQGNSFFGMDAGLSNTTGTHNTFVGWTAGLNNTTGILNNFATAIGADSLVSSSDTIALGRTSGADTVLVYGKMRVNVLGTAGPFAICLNANSEISSCSSSLRYKKNIAPFRWGLNVVNQLRPITFQWKTDGQPDIGFGAEDVARINSLFVTYNKDGQVEGVKYDRLTTVLVNAVKEQQGQIEEQRRQIEQQRESLQQQQAQIEALKTLVCSQNPTADVCKGQRQGSVNSSAHR
jgi:hypothetical protein